MGEREPSEALVEKVARAMAERRVPGSTSSGGEYHTSPGWSAVLEMDARAALRAIAEHEEGSRDA